MGPWAEPRETAEWVGEPYGRFLVRMNRGDFGEVLIVGPHSRRVRERQVGAVYGVDPPGPREMALRVEADHTEALRLNHQWDRKWAAGPPDFWLYRFYNRDGILLYIGITGSGVARFDQHGKQQSWWREVKTVEVEHYPTRAEVEAAELDLIRTSMPRYNRAHNPLSPHPSGRRSGGEA